MSVDAKQPSLLVTTEEAARLLSISPRTLWSLTRDGIVPCVRLGRSVRYSLDTLHVVIAGLEREKTSDRVGSLKVRQVATA